ncbi:unnamed protein product [Rotaria sp. Silwood1]|nr:unnamed protein product [Rotaria sp. Silwood1]CAF1206261.1 unnamed protein product [Rotaria sp. Silwood1]CAF3439544.1 unnamed protein product [Rotaria sp. Silwood1]CAF4538273.1 unnamed protein product [Rotaria sp. Silwood1]CAF4898679.1 unnamed protein product [Rotaria sp. Silwood1]
MNRPFFFVFILISIVICDEANRLYVNDKLVRVEPLTDEHIKYLQDLEMNSSLDFWTEITRPNKPVDIHINANEFGQYVSEFDQYSIPFNVVVDDLQTIIDIERQQIERDDFMRQIESRWLGQTKIDIVGKYVSYNDIVTYMQEKANNDPTHIQVRDMGNSHEGQSMKLISIQYNPSSTRNIWIDCGIHAREWITPAMCVWMIDNLIEDYNNNNPTIRDLLNYWTVYIAPVLNPDGYEFSRSKTRLWRKNRRNNNFLNCYGVDLNRNYPRKWMEGGASNSPCSETYGGSSAQSEIETKNVINFLTSKIGSWDMYMSFHSYGQLWLTPYGYSNNDPPNYQQHVSAAQAGANAIKGVNSKRTYEIGGIADVLYIATGSTVDWAYDDLKIPYSYTIELPPSRTESSVGFVLPPDQAPGVCHETYVGMKAFLVEVKKGVTGASTG